MINDESMRRLVLGDGTVLDNCECGYNEKHLWCYLKGYEFSEAYMLFSDPNKFETVSFEYGLPKHFRRIVYSGFTELSVIKKSEFSTDVRIIGSNIRIEEQDVDEEN